MLHEMLAGFLKTAQKNGLLDEYAEEHFLIQALNNIVPDFFANHEAIRKNCVNPYGEGSVHLNFIANFSSALEQLAQNFSEKDINSFIKGQLAAGKDKYNEDQFFQAYSECLVLRFLTEYAGKLVSKATYEPKLRAKGRKNPEARIEYADGTIFDVEVKTPSFPKLITIPERNVGVLKANTVISKAEKTAIESVCDRANIKFMMPRALKIKDFINSAANKFTHADHVDHFNILFINWTMSDFYTQGINEPIGLIANSATGVFHSKKDAKALGIETSKLKKISAIVIYRDSMDSMISSDFRWHYAAPKRIELVINDAVAPENHHKIARKLNRNPYDTQNSKWSPIDWAYPVGNEECKKVVVKTANEVQKILSVSWRQRGIYTFPL